MVLGLSARAVAPTKVTITGGKADRANAIVSFEVALDATSLQLRGDDGGVIPVQVHAGRAWCILPVVKAGESKTYRVEPGAPGVAGSGENLVSIVKDAGAMTFSSNQRPMIAYQSEKVPLPPGFEDAYLRGGYVHPVFSPSGKLITDDYPPKHKHHHGVFFSWTKTEFEGRHPDFWNMGSKTGRVDPAGVADSFSGLVCAGVRAKHTYVDMTATPEKVALNETWDLIAYRPLVIDGKPYYVFDVTSTQDAVDSPLILPKYHYGGFAVRGNRDWDEPGNPAMFLTSEGKTRENADEAPSRWAMIYGQIDGGLAGIAVLSHPTNFRAPQPVRIHPKEPYMCWSPSWLGDWKIEKGKPHVSRYRLVAGDGKMDAAMLDKLWEDFAEPVKVTAE
jgi:hypothetical protein